jgi:hypothetical protein
LNDAIDVAVAQAVKLRKRNIILRLDVPFCRRLQADRDALQDSFTYCKMLVIPLPKRVRSR